MTFGCSANRANALHSRSNTSLHAAHLRKRRRLKPRQRVHVAQRVDMRSTRRVFCSTPRWFSQTRPTLTPNCGFARVWELPSSAPWTRSRSVWLGETAALATSPRRGTEWSTGSGKTDAIRPDGGRYTPSCTRSPARYSTTSLAPTRNPSNTTSVPAQTEASASAPGCAGLFSTERTDGSAPPPSSLRRTPPGRSPRPGGSCGCSRLRSYSRSCFFFEAKAGKKFYIIFVFSIYLACYVYVPNSHVYERSMNIYTLLLFSLLEFRA